jgi:hypothetical protein
VDLKKVAAILDWKAPKDVRGIKSFIRMVGYCNTQNLILDLLKGFFSK